MVNHRSSFACLLLKAASTVCFLTASLHGTAGAREEAEWLIGARDLATLRDLDGLAVSPDGRWTVFQIRQADPGTNLIHQAWYAVPTVGGAVRRVAEAGEPIWMTVSWGARVNGTILAPPPVWSPDSRWIVYLRKEDGRTQIWRTRWDGRQTQQLTHNEGNTRRPVFSRDGLRILFESEPSSAQSEAAHVEESRLGYLFDRRFAPDYSRQPVYPPDVAFGASVQTSISAGRRIWSYDLASRRERLATETETSEYVALTTMPRVQDRQNVRGAGVVSQAGATAWLEARDQKKQGVLPPLTIVAQPAGVAVPIVCNAAECTTQFISGLWWRSEQEVIFARGEGWQGQDQALYSWRPLEDVAPRLILRTSGLLAYSRFWSCNVAQERLICFYEQQNSPRRLVAVDLDNGRIDTLHDPNPNFVGFDLGVPERIEIRAPSGVETYGYLVLPPHAGSGDRLPLVIVTYRCQGFLRGGTGDEYPIFPFAAQGFAVLCFNCPEADPERLTTMDRLAYQSWHRGPGDPEKHAVQQALDAAVAQLDRVGIIDPDRVGLTGLSFGAETVGYALFNMSRLTTTIASGTGNDPSGYYLTSWLAREYLRSWELGGYATMQRYQALAVSLNTSRVRAPLLLNVADREMLFSLAPVIALEEAGRAAEMHVFPDEYHIKWQPAHRLAIYNRNIDWMNFWLRGVEDPAPEKAEQYKRWRAMRAKQCELFKGDDAPWYCRK